MSYSYANRKKVRGWKRRVRELERFARGNLRIDPAALEQYERMYIKLRIDPWDRLVKRNPPVWYRRLALAAMVGIFESWHEQLQARGEPFYLALWLCHPRFHGTQVVAAIGGMLDYYENIFASVGPEPIPRELLVDGLLDATRFDWRTCSDDDYIEEEPGYMTAGEIARLAAIARETTTIGDGGEPRRLFTLRRGTVWVGTRGGA